MTNLDAAKVRESVRVATTDLVVNSKILKKEKEEELPHFDLPEIEKGKRLGAGAFGIVWEIKNVAMAPAAAPKESLPGDDDDDDENDLAFLSHEARRFISNTCLREDTKASRYAVKILRPELTDDPALFEKGCIDLAMEANFLSNFVHPNIIKVRGAGEEKLIGTKDYFLVMDRLYGTLEGKLEEWKATQKKMGMFGNKAAKQDFLKDRLNVAFELSAALDYMHARK
jgi:serine/threonine protein kinase